MGSIFTDYTAKAIHGDFTAAVESGRNVACDSRGNWHYEWGITSFFRWIFGLQDSRDADVLEAFNQGLANLERKVVVLNAAGREKNADFKTYFVAGNALMNRFKNRTGDVATQINLLERRIVALKYRIESVNGGLDQIEAHLVDGNHFAELLEQAKVWKNEQIKFSHASKKELTNGSKQRLALALRYPEFIKLLKTNPSLRNEFFEWIITFRNEVRAFIEFPAVQARLNEAQMGACTGSYFGQCLRSHVRGLNEAENKESDEDYFKEEMDRVKDVTLRFETSEGKKELSILDEDLPVVFTNAVASTIKIVIDAFKDRVMRWGQFEVLNGKIYSWGAHEIGANTKHLGFVRADLTLPEWWKALPPVKTLSIEQAKRWYGAHCDGENFGAKIMATREYLDLRVSGTHSYLEVAAPIRDDSGRVFYHVYSFAKYPKKLPRKFTEIPRAVAGTSDACISYPDQSIPKREREHDGHSLGILTPADGIRLMDLIKSYILDGRQGNLAYQLFVQNCGMWACQVASDLFPARREEFEGLFATSFMNAKPLGLAGCIFSAVKIMPASIQGPFLHLFFLPFGSTIAKEVQERDGRVKKISLWNQPVWGPGQSAQIPAAWFMRRDGIDLAKSM